MDDKESVVGKGVSCFVSNHGDDFWHRTAAGLRTTNGCTHLHLEKDARGVSCECVDLSICRFVDVFDVIII